jgi:hypothetical protein
MNIVRLVRCGLLTTAMALPLVACDSSKPAEPPPEVTSTGSPAMEGTGADEPGAEVDGVSVSLPGVPVGGRADDESKMRQCVTASWLGGDPVPEGVSVEVTGIRIVPDDVFDIVGSRCGGIVGCTESFTFTADGELCSVLVEARAADVRSADLFMSGKAHCADRDEQRCEDLPGNIPEKSIDLTQPGGDEGDEETGEMPSESQDQQPSEEEPSHGETATDSTG